MQNWEFYLVGVDYTEHISNKIENAKNWGEQNRGLCSCINNGRVKLYVRKWSDILQVEWGVKMKYLKEKLCIRSKPISSETDSIVSNLLGGESSELS